MIHRPGHYPYYDHLPKDRAGNATKRRFLLRLGNRDVEAAREMYIMCRRDPLFFINAFVYTYNPRKYPSTLPFITYEYQDQAINEILTAMADHDVFIEKSREMGGTWIVLACIYWAWQFRDLQSFLLGSRKEEYVDKAGDPKTLFWKLDFILEHLPKWLRPEYTRNQLHLYNEDNGSTIDGESTNVDFARGDRRTTIMLDEFASVNNGDEVLSSTRDATSCRIMVSTPKGMANAFYDMRSKCESQITLHWSLHPEKAEGLYKDANGKFRSPWYDRECKRAGSPAEIAQELDIDYQGSDFRFFDEPSLAKVEAEDVRPPYNRGEIQFDFRSGTDPVFKPDEDGNCLLWCQLDGKDEPPGDSDYVMGIDVSTGTAIELAGPGKDPLSKTSNSCISVVSVRTGEKLCEIAVAGMMPHRFAVMAIACANWFSGASGRGAFMIWEANGPGVIFGNTIVQLGYQNFHYRRRNPKGISGKSSDQPGWWSSPESNLELLGNYRRALQNGDFTNRSRSAIKECRYYIHLQNGRVAHSRSARGADPTGAGQNHGDRVIADALAVHALKSLRTHEKHLHVQGQAPTGSFAWRRQRYERSRRAAESVY